LLTPSALGSGTSYITEVVFHAAKDIHLRFRTNQKPHGLMSRKLQVRLTLMFVMLGLVLVGSKVVGRAEFWAKIFPDSQPTESADSETAVVNYTTLRPELKVNSTTASVRVLRDDLQNSIEDDVMGVSAAETKAWGRSMELAERITSKQAKQLPTARYALMMDAPNDCRGRAWKITGTLRRMTEEKLTNHSLDYRDVVDAWLTLPDSGNSLVHVVALQSARNLPFAAEFDKDAPEVTISGYFFKREAYASSAEGGLSIAPLLLAGSISRVPMPVSTETRADQLTPWLGWLAVFTCGTLALIVWSFASSDVANHSERTHELTRLPASPSFEGVTIETPHETLQQLETAAEAAAPEFNIEQL
jgi:hypothetical protein